MANPSVNATNSRGMDRAVWNNIAEKDDFERNKKVMLWIQAVTGEENIDVNDMMAMLRDGYLCWQLLLKIDPDIRDKMKKRKFKATRTTQPFKARNQIEVFTNGCKLLGMSDIDCLTSQTLYNGEMPHVVCNHMYALCALAQKLNTFKGPYIDGAFKHSKVSKREFTEETLAKSRAAVPKMMQGKDMPDSGESGDSAGIVKQTKSMQKWKHDTVESTFATGASIKVDTGNKLDGAGILKTAGNEDYRASTEPTQMSKGSKKVVSNTRDFVGITGKAQ